MEERKEREVGMDGGWEVVTDKIRITSGIIDIGKVLVEEDVYEYTPPPLN